MLGFCADKASKWHNYTEILFSTWQLDCSRSCYSNHEDYYCCESEVIVNLYFLKSAMNLGPWISHHHRSLWAASYNSSNLFYISPNTHFALHSTSKMIIRLNWFSSFLQFRTSRSLGTLSTNFSKFALNKVTWMKDRLDVDLRHDAENFYNGTSIKMAFFLIRITRVRALGGARSWYFFSCAAMSQTRYWRAVCRQNYRSSSRKRSIRIQEFFWL